MSVAVYSSVSLEPVECYRCSVIFGLPSEFYRHRVEDHKDWYCPNGHSQQFIGETEAEKYKRLFNAAKDREAAARAERDQVQASLTATKGVVTKLRKRAITGTCAFCHRHFANVERHVANKHPNEAP
jgi:hypothetical protein